jgi:uncharacterized protein RhaS with RHS repeats
MLGFYQMGARYYSPGMGRFTQQDPLGRSVFTANRYAYADCNPANKTDPTGLVPREGSCGLSDLESEDPLGGLFDIEGEFGVVDFTATLASYVGPIVSSSYTIEWTNLDTGVSGTIEGGGSAWGGFHEGYYSAQTGPGTIVAVLTGTAWTLLGPCEILRPFTIIQI